MLDPKIILVVEDDFSVRETLKYALESEGYTVVVSRNGPEGLERLRSAPQPNLVLLDFLLPLKGSANFLQELLADATLAKIPVVIISAALESAPPPGALAHVKKPIDLDQLLEAVNRYLGEAHALPSPLTEKSIPPS